MTKEYISRDEMIEQTKARIVLGAPKFNTGLKAAIEVATSISAADVAPVRHGRWIKDDDTGEPICSVCYSGKPTRAVFSSVIEHKLNNHEIRYCYYCGAKMDGGQDE